MLECDARLQPLGYLAWAACGKDPGFGPKGILEEAARGARYSGTEIATLDFEGEPPDAAELGRRWHTILAVARDIVDILPAADAGCCVLDEQGNLVRHAPSSLRGALAHGNIRFHMGSIRGALPHVRPAS